MVIATWWEYDLDESIALVNSLRCITIENMNAQHFPASLPRIYNVLNEITHRLLAYHSCKSKTAQDIEDLFSQKILPLLPLDLPSGEESPNQQLQKYLDEYEEAVCRFDLQLAKNLKTFVFEFMEERIGDIGRMDEIVEQAASSRRAILQKNTFDSGALMEKWGSLEEGMMEDLDDSLLQGMKRLPGGKEVGQALFALRRSGGTTEERMDIVKLAMILWFNHELDKFIVWLRALGRYIMANKKEVRVDMDDSGAGIRSLKHFVDMCIEEDDSIVGSY